MDAKKIAKLTLLTTLILFLSKFSGFLRDVALAFAYGTTIKADAFILTTSTINIFSIFFSCLAMAYMPVYKRLSIRESNENCKRFVDTVYTIIGAFSCILALLGFLFSNIIVSFLAPGFSEYTTELTISVMKVMIWVMPLTFLFQIGSQHLRGIGSFLVPAAIPIPCNLILVVGLIFISPIFDLQGVAYIYIFGVLVQVVILQVLLLKKGYRYKVSFDFSNIEFQKICILALPILLGDAIQTINTMIDRILASGLMEGSIAALNFSNKLSLFVIGIITAGAGNICFAKMSELGALGDNRKFIDFFRTIINTLNIVIVPSAVGLLVLSEPIVITVFNYGAFGETSIKMTATALVFYSIGLIGYILRDMITRAFYSIQDSKTPMINGALAVMINIAGNIILVRVMGIGGLALATSISAIVGTLLLLVSFRRKVGHIGGREMTGTFLKCLFAAVIMGAAVRNIYNNLFRVINIVPIALIISIAVGVCIYSLMVLFIKIPEVDFITNRIFKRVKKSS